MIAWIAAFVLGIIAYWTIARIFTAIAWGGSKMGTEARQKWLAKQDYDQLLRLRKQIDDEIARRQP
jgi:hypothetical protein